MDEVEGCGGGGFASRLVIAKDSLKHTRIHRLGIRYREEPQIERGAYWIARLTVLSGVNVCCRCWRGGAERSCQGSADSGCLTQKRLCVFRLVSFWVCGSVCRFILELR